MPSNLSGDKETPKTCYELPRPMEWIFFPNREVGSFEKAQTSEE